MFKITGTILIVAVSILFNSQILIAQEEARAPEEQDVVTSKNSIYSYDISNPPQFFFFPKEKARWDGSRVTMKEWYMLTDIQKEKFITEYMSELQEQYKVPIDIFGLELEYLTALNMFSAYSNAKTMNEPSTKFIDILLSGQGKIVSGGKSGAGEKR